MNRPLVYLVTLSRSDYASMRPVALAAQADESIDAKLIAGGSHLLARYGNTIEHIKKDGLSVHEVAEFLTEEDDSPEELANAYAKAAAEFAGIFAEGKPDSVFIIGDRWEMLPVANAASLLQIPIIHHSGGDITQGSADNQTRYALSCLAHMHLVALPQHRDRLLAMGEEDWRVITTGEPALTQLADYAQAAGDIYETLNLETNAPFVLATFHPTSFDSQAPEHQIALFLKALDSIKEPIILTAPNPDAASDIFLQKLKAYADRHEHVQLFESLGAQNYYAAMSKATFMIGNSSSGLWEAPSFKLPVVNIGPRQRGRLHGDNVVNAALDMQDIAEAIRTVSAPDFAAALTGENPYVHATTLELILDTFKHPHDKAKLLAKRFVAPLHV